MSTPMRATCPLVLLVALLALASLRTGGVAHAQDIPEPIPPHFDSLKDLHLTTHLVGGGRANATIIKPASGRYDAQALAIRQAIREVTGVSVPIADDDSPTAAVPITGNLIALGNRSTNATIEKLYNRYYTLLDLKYPGPRGHVVRTLHDPFGDGHNVVLAGGSDDEGVAAVTTRLIERLRQAGGDDGELTIGWLADIRLGDGVEIPEDPREFEQVVRNGRATPMKFSRRYRHWDAAEGYGSMGPFGWNCVAKRMAMYYMTGDEAEAREFLRLAFPDEQARRDMKEIDGEHFEGHESALLGLSHYNAHLMILLWDLIEESPVFSDEERLRVTNAFSDQLEVRVKERVYEMTEPRDFVPDRHGQWSAISLYCLARYFDKYYPDPIWEQALRGSEMIFAPLRKSSWVGYANDHLWWYNTTQAPILTWMLLSGDRTPLQTGALQERLLGQEMLISGRLPDWALDYGGVDFLNQAAYLTGDGRWLEYRDRIGLDLGAFRLGQSFWPAEDITPHLPDDLVGKWNVNRLPEPMWRWRDSGLPPEQSFMFGSFRSTPDASGDFILLDGFNGGGRNPYHTFPILELRMDGYTVLRGFRNQVLTRADGLVEPEVAMDGALVHADVVGATAVAVGEVPNAAYCNWRRTLMHRVGHYALVVDELTMRTASDNLQVQTTWETPTGTWDAEQQAVRVTVPGAPRVPEGWHLVRVVDAEYSSDPAGEEMLRSPRTLPVVQLRATAPGPSLAMRFQLDEPLEGEVFAELYEYVNCGVFRAELDGEAVGEEHDSFSVIAGPGRMALGARRLEAGAHELRLTVTGLHKGQEKGYVTLVGLSVRPDGAPEDSDPAVFEIRPADPVAQQRRYYTNTLDWYGEVAEGQTLRFFTLITRDQEKSGASLACLRLAENAAALALPEPALAVAGTYAETKADACLLTGDHLHGRRLLSAGMGPTLAEASAPVDLDWDFTTGRAEVVAEGATELRLRVAGEGTRTIALAAGRQVIEDAAPDPEALAQVRETLATRLNEARQSRAAQGTAAQIVERAQVPELPAVMRAEVGAPVVDLELMGSADRQFIAVAAGSEVRLLAPDGSPVQTLTADAQVRCLRWWAEAGLLLVGCADEQVIAFDQAGERAWVFVSEDTAEVRGSGWSKSVPGMEGIHGLHTGVFMDGESQAFVGAAGTIEIVDRQGQLVARHPYLWGTVNRFAIVDAPDGSLNLIASADANGRDEPAIINSLQPNPRRRGFYRVPEGHTFVSGWSAMNRDHIVYQDLDGDGEREVICETNGSWNRVTVWQADGTPVRAAHFGAGDKAPARNMLDLEIADLDGDGKKQILVSTSAGLLVCLDHQCERLWSRRLHSPAEVLAAVGGRIIAGCRDGTVLVLRAEGVPVAAGEVTGRPTRIMKLGASGAVIIATDAGAVGGFGIDD